MCPDVRPVSVVPPISLRDGSDIPWSQSMFRHTKGCAFQTEGQMKELRPCYVQGVCVGVHQLDGLIFSKRAHIITVRLCDRRKIDLDIWCLNKHIMHGAATIVPGSGDPLSIANGSRLPLIGDLIFAQVHVQAALADGIDLDGPVSSTATTETTLPTASA